MSKLIWHIACFVLVIAAYALSGRVGLGAYREWLVLALAATWVLISLAHTPIYALFLCLRYLRRRAIAYFAVLGVALCVAMMLIVVSVMNGFLDKIEQAAKGLFGDIVVDTGSLSGLRLYDGFIAEVSDKVPEVHAASPFIQAYGILRVPNTTHRQPITIAGIRLPERAEVTDFEEGLFVQKNASAPSFDPPVADMRRALTEITREAQSILRREEGQSFGKPLPREKAHLIDQVKRAGDFHRDAEYALEQAAPYQEKLRQLQEELDAARAALARQGPGPVEDLENRLRQLAGRMVELEQRARIRAPERRIILGLGLMALSFRTEQGETVRVIVPGNQVVLTLVPLGRRAVGAAGIIPNTEAFTVVDDCRTDVWSIDSNVVYVPFETLQRMNDMEAQYSVEEPGRIEVPARCSQIHIKVKSEFAKGPKLRVVRDKIERVWLEFKDAHRDYLTEEEVSVMTWPERQAKVIAPIQQQRTLSVIMFAVISMVAVVLIFVIFYMIVYQKTKDIGVLKAVGASSRSVAGIFLYYGAAIGLVGSVLGTIGGYFFVRYINQIRDASEKWFGFGVWSKEYFLFEKIPNVVNPVTAVQIVIAAIVASLLGAVIPAIRAARLQPVEALRYE